MNRRSVLAAAAAVVCSRTLATAAVLYGGPTYNPATSTGYSGAALPYNPGSTAGDGVGVGYATKYTSGTNVGSRAVRWDTTGVTTELGILGTASGGITDSQAKAVNAAGTVVGFATKYTAGTNVGDRAVRWDSNGVATELGNLGTASSGFTNSQANAVNATGTAVGYATKYTSGTSVGTRAVRWETDGVATELGNLGTASSGMTNGFVRAVNATGTAVGYVTKYTSGTNVGDRAVRWDSNGVATELGNLGTASSGFTSNVANAVNATGTAVGYANKYTSGANVGSRAVRWDSNGVATELGNLGTTSSGTTDCLAYAVNANGTAVGYANKYTNGTDVGVRAVRWETTGVATELGNLGTTSSGATSSVASAVNATGTAVGYAVKYTSGTSAGSHAVAWSADGVAVDLNTLLSSADAFNWILRQATAITDTGWITGTGSYHPDGPGSQSAYTRAFLIQYDAAPEPNCLLAVGLFTVPVLRRRRRSRT